MLAWFGSLAENQDFQAFEPREFIAQGDKVVALVYLEETTRRTGRKTTHTGAHVWTFRDGKVVRLRIFEDTAALAGALRGE